MGRHEQESEHDRCFSYDTASVDAAVIQEIFTEREKRSYFLPLPDDEIEVTFPTCVNGGKILPGKLVALEDHNFASVELPDGWNCPVPIEWCRFIKRAAES